MQDPYLYPGTGVLKNLADIRDEETLKEMEADYTLSRLSDVVTDSSVRRFDFDALCELHYSIFQDVYEWAGKPRVINIEKSEAVLGDLSIEYSDCFDISRDATNILNRMNEVKWKELSEEERAKTFGICMAELWKVHPFREGNTRTIVTFCCIFIEAQGIYIESELFKENAGYTRTALVAATAKFHDLGDLRKPEYLYRIVRDALEQGKKAEEQIKEELKKAKIVVTEKNIRDVMLWNRKSHCIHTAEEIYDYLIKKKSR